MEVARSQAVIHLLVQARCHANGCLIGIWFGASAGSSVHGGERLCRPPAEANREAEVPRTCLLAQGGPHEISLGVSYYMLAVAGVSCNIRWCYCTPGIPAPNSVLAPNAYSSCFEHALAHADARPPYGGRTCA